MTTPSNRIRVIRENEADSSGDYVLYWMTAYRRLGWNFALQRAAEEASRLAKPLIILDALGLQYPWASDRTHSFVIDGMLELDSELAELRGALYYPYIEERPGTVGGLVKALADRACLAVMDDSPAELRPSWMSEALNVLDVHLETVDSNGLMPIAAEERAYTSAFDFRRFVQKNLPTFLDGRPLADPLDLVSELPAATISNEVLDRWPPMNRRKLSSKRDLSSLPLDHAVRVTEAVGGPSQARDQLRGFIQKLLSRYEDDRSNPEIDGTSGLSPYLHHGHISTQEVLDAVAQYEDWDPGKLAPTAQGKKQGWWGMSSASESFLDELVVWRELGFNAAFRLPKFNRYESLPEWARETLSLHSSDERESLYDLEELESASTSDEVWNAAQRQLVTEGRIHNYLRMLWGKKVITWSKTPEEAADRLLALNDKYALDGQDPNSVSGIFWCFGRYDRPWPERPIYGRIRSMTSESAVRKFGLRRYLETYADA